MISFFYYLTCACILAAENARQAIVEVLLPLLIVAEDHRRMKATAGEDGV